jgi:hypothetical protein
MLSWMIFNVTNNFENFEATNFIATELQLHEGVGYSHSSSVPGTLLGYFFSRKN